MQGKRNLSWPARVTVHQVPTERKGHMGCCLGVLYGYQPIIHEWLDYHSALGVSHYRIYYAPRHYGDIENPHMTEFVRDDVAWQQVLPLDGRHRRLYSQVTMLNECLYRLKYAYDYILMTDIDEFLVINPNKSQHNSSLPMFMDSVLPARTTAAVFLTWGYPSNCQPPASPNTTEYQRHIMRHQLLSGLCVEWLGVRAQLLPNVFDQLWRYAQ